MDDTQILKMKHDGRSLSEIAAEAGCSRQAIHKRLQKLDPSPEIESQVGEMGKAGNPAITSLTASELFEILGELETESRSAESGLRSAKYQLSTLLARHALGEVDGEEVAACRLRITELIQNADSLPEACRLVRLRYQAAFDAEGRLLAERERQEAERQYISLRDSLIERGQILTGNEEAELRKLGGGKYCHQVARLASELLDHRGRQGRASVEAVGPFVFDSSAQD
jgi:DNA-binding CsgD family transcriptional regulator